MLRDVHRERGFAHRWPGSNDHHLPGVETAGHFVQIGETSAHPCENTLALVKIFDGINRLFDQIFNRNGLALNA